MSELTIILTVFKRSSCEEQLERLKIQTLEHNVIIYQNETHVDISRLRNKYSFKHIHSLDINFKFYGRFALPLLLDTEYCCILDDDLLPNPDWLMATKFACQNFNAIIGSNGRILLNHSLEHQKCIDLPQKNVLVDYVGHSWFFRTEWIKNLWTHSIPTFENGEDISFCAANNLAGINSMVISCENERQIGDSNRFKYGTDSNSFSQNNPYHNMEREQVVQYWLNKGWEPLNRRFFKNEDFQ
jgi:hypothetical protein